MTSLSTESRLWWRQKRMLYNTGLLVAGVLAFICYALVLSFFHRDDRLSDVEITVFTIVLQGIGYLVMMLIANLFYFLGPLVEWLSSPKYPERFRRILFNCGFCFSIGLPFIVPGMLLYLLFTVPVID